MRSHISITVQIIDTILQVSVPTVCIQSPIKIRIELTIIIVRGVVSLILSTIVKPIKHTMSVDEVRDGKQ